jgi:hypothetical protein
MTDSTARPSSAGAPSAELAGVLDGATTAVPTRALLGRGVEKIRVLSESRFVDLVRGMVEDSIRRRAQIAPKPVAASPAPAVAVVDTELRDQLQANWSKLREKHEGHLGTIEERLSRLTGAFDAIRGSLERLETSKPRSTAPRRGASKALRRELETRALRESGAS